MNTFGQLFRVTTFGESHGPAIGCVIDGCPPGVSIAPEDFVDDLARRATGRAATARWCSPVTSKSSYSSSGPSPR